MFARLPPRRAAAAAALLIAATQAQAGDVQLKEVTIQSTREDLQGTATSAGEGIVTARQLQTRPIQRAGDIMEAVPGLVATQHAGEGKANQYFLRGFNLDHGTDFATWVDGVPINLPTHGHGQGYTDLNFLIPELVESVQYRKGPYYAEEGDFSAAGSARIRTSRRLAQPFAKVETGSFGYRRALAAGSLPAAAGDLMLAAEQGHDDGPWTVPQGLRKTNLFAKYSQGSAGNGASVGVSHYEASWISTDQVPQRAIERGLIGRFGTLDPTAGGRTSRTALNGSWASSADGVNTRVSAYVLRYRFDLFSDFTYYTRGCEAAPLPPPCDGNVPLDEFEQVDRRHAWGANASQLRTFHVGDWDGNVSYGADLRRDDIAQVALYDAQRRVRLAAVRSDRVLLDALGLWSQGELQFGPHWRAQAGLRWDRHQADVASSAAGSSGHRSAAIASPKFSLAYLPHDRLDVYANWGRGFHSNDVRSAGATPLVRAEGYELGARRKWDTLVATASLWTLKLASELVFAGDAGTTEASRPSRRSGLEVAANWRPAKAWEIDADLALTRARFADSDAAGDRVPGAMERVGTLGVTWQDGPWTVGSRLRHFGAHPLIENNSLRAAASTLLNLRAAYNVNARVELSLDVFNVFDRRANDIEYAYASRLPGEPAFVDGVTPATVHLHPTLPRSLRLGLKLGF